MAVVSRVCSLRFSNSATSSSRTWVATATTQDISAGSAVSITITQTSAGPTPPAASEALTLNVYIDAGGTLVRTINLNPVSGSQTISLLMSSDGITATTPAARCGTLRLRLQAVNTTSGGATGTYNVDTDLTNSAPPTGYTVSQADPGWVRGTTTVTVAASNVAAGGALPGPTTLPVGATFFPNVFAYPDTIYQRATLAAPAYGAPTLTMAFGALSGLSSPGSETFDRTHPSVTFAAYLAAVNTVTQNVTPSNAALTGLPFTVFTTTTAPDAKVDPRLLRESLFQLDDNTFATPPSSKHIPMRRRLVTQQAFLADRTFNARGEGQNGITYNISLTSEKPGTPVTSTGLTTVTQGGQVGYSSSFTSWQSTLPAGIWRKSVTLTAPAAVTPVFDSSGTARYVLGVDSTETGIYALVAGNPNLVMVVGGGPSNFSADKGHATPGLPFIIGMLVVDTSILTSVAVDADPAALAFLGRLNFLTGKTEYLTADGVTWTPLTGATAYGFSLTPSPTDANLRTRTFPAEQTATWGTADVFVVGRALVEGAPVVGFSKEPVVSAINSHSGYMFDGAGFIGFPSK